MASRVSVTVNVRDNSRAGIRQVRNAIRRMNDDIQRAGGTADFRVTVNGNSVRQTRATIRRLQRQLGNQRVVINTRVAPPDRQRFRRTVMNTLTSPARTAGGMLGGIMSDGIGQGIIQGFRTAGPIGMAVLATIITGALSVVGAALSGLLVTALGLAFVSIGGISAAMSEQIKTKWKGVLETIKDEFRTVGEPLIPVLDRALGRLEKMVEVAGPKLRKAIEETAPATEQFLNKIMDSFENFGKEAFQPIMDAWNVFAPVFGDQWDQFMTDLGRAFGDMAKLVEEHPTEIAAALGIVLGAIVLLIDTITFFGQVWVNMMNGALEAVAFVITAMADLGIVVVNTMGTIVGAAARGLGWIPGIGDGLKKANEGFTIWRDHAVGKLEGVKEKANEMKGALDRANKLRRLEADISQWQSQLDKARKDLKRTSDQKAVAKLKGNISDLVAKLNDAARRLNAMDGKSATTYVYTQYLDRVTNGGGRAHGGVVGAAATGGVRSNMTMVGEAGPELVSLPPGSHVRSNPDTRRMMKRQQANGPGAAFTIKSSGRRVDDMLIEILREAIHQRGGDPVLVLGGN
jgi:hypothetical protein